MANVLKNNKEAAAELPPHPETYHWADVEDVTHSQLHTFRHAGIIQVVEPRCSRNDHTTLWKTHKGVADWLEYHDDTVDGTPCGNATGIRTIQPGTYTCSCDDCDCRMDRETAEQVIA